ncbi:MAG: hypothetical protein JOZ49_14165 [Mycolicibacterium sp.]|nr:hypothetical protein [Mycolicibacterium sp.]
MRISDRAKLGVVAASLLAAVALAAGCDAAVNGRLVGHPGSSAGPTVPTPTPSRPVTTPVSPPGTPSDPPAPPTPGPPPGAEELAPNARGYVFIETKSGETRCRINREAVGCESQFANSPLVDGEHANGVNVTADGTVRWVLGNLGAMPVVTLDYATYSAQDWTIQAGSDGTRFTNNRTGHGMFVSVEEVDTF